MTYMFILKCALKLVLKNIQYLTVCQSSISLKSIVIRISGDDLPVLGTV